MLTKFAMSVGVLCLTIGVVAMAADIQSNWALSAPLGMTLIWFTSLSWAGMMDY